MNTIADIGLIEIEYNHQQYENMEFIRVDRIQNITYITLKHVLTGEMYTFEENKIQSIRKKMKIMPQKTLQPQNQLADNDSYSLY
ncbi:hypothetical protein ACQCT6_19915 [Cytobacillus gottheilii]|uniref:Uncharacterized protein n=1 Tax=Cytobacillus gottheilii TaxID=859144 RepID=A0ABX8F601_9BACI|nr:hypothetical protein [Cytobacillus gottheilii]QVY59863.1 hypothetical protein J1899_12440 [Cytobacillus gottheilii]